MAEPVAISPAEEAPDCTQQPNEDLQGETKGGYQMGELEDLGPYTIPAQHNSNYPRASGNPV